MAVFPLAAAVVALVFAALLSRQFVARRRPYQALWTVALLMYAAASFALFLGVLSGWTPAEYRVYWLFGAVLNVPFLAQGEIHLLARRPAWLAEALLLALLFGTAFAATRVRTAHLDVAALSKDLPRGRDAFRRDAFALHLAQLYSYPAYTLLVVGTLWSAWRMRRGGGPRDRFLGTLGIAVGATIVAAGAAFAAVGSFVGFSLTLVAGIAVMFWGFLRASRPASSAAH